MLLVKNVFALADVSLASRIQNRQIRGSHLPTEAGPEMAENTSNQWAQIKDFLKKAGDDMKRVGEDIKVETTRLVEELRDPDKQAKAKEKLSELGVWAKTTAQGAADLADAAMKKIEERMN